MNKERLYEVANLLETLAPEKFDMTRWITMNMNLEDKIEYNLLPNECEPNHCGTAGCIAGWAVMLKHGLSHFKIEIDDVAREAADWLDITNEEADNLFYLHPSTVWGYLYGEVGLDLNFNREEREFSTMTNIQVAKGLKYILDNDINLDQYFDDDWYWV